MSLNIFFLKPSFSAKISSSLLGELIILYKSFLVFSESILANKENSSPAILPLGKGLLKPITFLYKSLLLVNSLTLSNSAAK